MGNVAPKPLFLIPPGIEYAYEATSFLASIQHIGQRAVLSATGYVKAHAWVDGGSGYCADPMPHALVCTITCIVLVSVAQWGRYTLKIQGTGGGCRRGRITRIEWVDGR